MMIFFVTSCPGFLERLVGLIFFFKSVDFFFVFNLHVISCIQMFFLQTWGQNYLFSSFIRISFSVSSQKTNFGLYHGAKWKKKKEVLSKN